MQYRTLLSGAALCLWGAVGLAQQQTPDPQPGRKWTEAELKAASSIVRAGKPLTPSSWPNGAMVAVCLSFDVENFTAQLALGDTAPVALSGGEFGAVQGLARILDVLDRQNVPATFFVTAAAAIFHPRIIDQIQESGRHEIGAHGWLQENVEWLDDPAEERRLMDQAIDYLTRVTGKRPVGNRNPKWTFSQHTMGLIHEAGFLYDSTLQAMDEPYEILLDGEPTGIVELPINQLMDDERFLTVRTGPGILPSPELMAEVYMDDFDVAYRERTLFMITLHPRVIGMRSRIPYLERLIEHVKSKPGVWIATAEDIARYVKQQAGMTEH